MSNVPMTLPEMARAIHETPYFHSSTFTELEDGRILHGAGHVFTISEDGGITWSEPFDRKDVNGKPVGGGGTSLTRLSGEGVGLAAMMRDSSNPRANSRMAFWRSEDAGETWEAPVMITPEGIGTHAYQDVLLRTSSGRIILPVYISMGQSIGPNNEMPPKSGKLVGGHWVSTAAHFFDPHFSCSYVCFSDDDGRTWQRNSDGELMILMDWSAVYSYTNEPSVTEVTPGKLLMFMRNALGRLFQSWSYDNGETWTRPAPTQLASSTAPCQIRTLPNGHLLCVWNQESEEEVRRGYNRTRISSAISRDGGGIWEFFQNVESMHEETRVEPGPIRPVRPAEISFEPGTPAPEREREHVLGVDFHGRWSYPSVLVMKDRVLIAHTYSTYREHPTRAELVLSNREPGSFNQKLKVLPIPWFYGGKEPADNPFIKRAHEPAKP